jgi:phenylacetyl-CoA:acceptor oxidoreductase subunit 1
MTRYVMVADLRRCVGCQTCTASCKEANGTPVGVQWRRVLDIEAGEYPEVSRVFVPTGCQHCDKPPCMEVCPSTATAKRADGLVTIDYDLCIGCAYCIMACPYEARFKIEEPMFAFGAEPMAAEKKRFDPRHVGVVTKCTFCIDRIDAGLAKGLVPGRDPEATPVCAQACISGALRFGDIEDPTSEVSQLIANNKWFRMHESEGTGPGFYYLWDKEQPL